MGGNVEQTGGDRGGAGGLRDEEDPDDRGPVGAGVGRGVHVPADGAGAGPAEGGGPGVRHVGEARLRRADVPAGDGAEAGHPRRAPP